MHDLHGPIGAEQRRERREIVDGQGVHDDDRAPRGGELHRAESGVIAIEAIALDVQDQT